MINLVNCRPYLVSKDWKYIVHKFQVFIVQTKSGSQYYDICESGFQKFSSLNFQQVFHSFFQIWSSWIAGFPWDNKYLVWSSRVSTRNLIHLRNPVVNKFLIKTILINPPGFKIVKLFLICRASHIILDYLYAFKTKIRT